MRAELTYGVAGTLIVLVAGISVEPKPGTVDPAPSAIQLQNTDEHLDEQEVNDEKKILAVLDAFVDAWNRHDAEQAALVYTDPHFDINATPQEEDRQTTVEKFSKFYNDFDTNISVTSDEVVLLGDFAVQRGQFILTSTPKGGGETEVITRRYIEVLRKDTAGNWAVYWGIDGPLAGDSPPVPVQ